MTKYPKSAPPSPAMKIYFFWLVSLLGFEKRSSFVSYLNQEKNQVTKYLQPREELFQEKDQKNERHYFAENWSMVLSLSLIHI